jgi:hypothetical protein
MVSDMPSSRPKNTVYVSMAITREEKAQLDAAVKKAGVNRNRFLRNFIASLGTMKK